jgi:signal transduction histidine kinase
MTRNPQHVTSAEHARLAALYQVSHALGASLDHDATLRLALDSAIRLTRAERGFLMLLDDTGALNFRLALDAHGAPLDESQFQISRSVVHEVAGTGAGVVTTDARADPRFAQKDSVVQYALRSILAVPLKARGRITGVLYVDNKARDALFTRDDLDLLAAFAGQAAVAIENARLHTHTDRALAARVDELQTLHTIDRELNSAALDLAQVAQVTLDWALRRTGAGGGWLALVDHPAGGAPAAGPLLASHGVALRETFTLDDPLLARSLASGEVLRRGLGTAPLGGGTSAPAALAAPLRREQRVMALLLLEHHQRPFTLSDAEFIARLADHAAIALENARLYAAVTRANDAKSEFVRTVSHELKIPMTSIKGYTDLLKMVGPLNAQQEQFVATIRNNVERMAQLVSDLADIARIETGRLNLELRPLDLPALLPEAFTALRAQIEARQQTLTFDLPADLPKVQGDETRLLQVVANLVSNAHKYSPAGAPIRVSARAETGLVRLGVTDQGYGISPADQARLFTQFFRSDDPLIREQTGWGLGLHLTRHLVELFGGEITVESRLGEGSTFTFTLPIAAE